MKIICRHFEAKLRMAHKSKMEYHQPFETGTKAVLIYRWGFYEIV
jgi:hypothetical protein